MTGIPIFPAGVVKIYTSPKSFMDDLDLSRLSFEKFKGATKLRTEKFYNLLLQPEFKEIKIWVEECAKDFLDNILKMEYEEFFITESWMNICEKGAYQGIHNHSNSIISGVLYLNSKPGHPPLEFKKMTLPQEPFISLKEHYKKGNSFTASALAFPCTQNTMIVFNSYLYHGHDESVLEEERVGIAWNGLVNFDVKDKDIYRIRFVREDS